MSTVRITYNENNPSITRKIEASADKKKIINDYIRKGKDLKELDGKGIKLKLPL